jgi:RHS repeat-associated protein
LDRKYREEYINHNLIRCNQLLNFRGNQYSYGQYDRTQTEQTIDAIQHYHYGAKHRLSEVRIEQTDRSQRYGYVYDALGQRIEKHQLDSAGKPYNRTLFLWDGLRMIQETCTNHPTNLYIYTDLNGCPEELTGANGEILWECSFQLWGKRIHEIEHEPIEQNIRYQGQYLDREAGLHYNTFRYYDPDIGRFTQPDPIGLLGGFNLYQYAPNGLTWVDPWRGGVVNQRNLSMLFNVIKKVDL